jgi:hypothetical protein
MRLASWIIGSVLATAACSTPPSATDLHTAGPPMVEQIRLTEVVDGNPRVVFGFGGHDGATADDAHPVTTAAAASNKLRIIMDELLRGNNLEEISCRGIVDDNAFGRVPLGTTPDDVARCSVSRDLLPSRCPGSNPHSVCICQNEAGCMVDGNLVSAGDPVGVKDLDQDGAADASQFLDGAVSIVCDTVPVPLNLDLSYWNPSGTQQTPAMGGFDALGPAIVLQTSGPLPTTASCTVVFSPDVVDKDGNQVCAPPDGDVTSSCDPGDTSAIVFMTEPLGFTLATSAPGKPRTADIKIRGNVPLDPASLATITIIEGADTVFTDFTATLGTGAAVTDITIHPTLVDGFAANTTYKITLPTTVTDTYHKAAAQPFEVSFTTGDM